MWRVFKNALCVDHNVQRKGIELASKCMCCYHLSLETLDHLLLHSDMEREVRGYFTNLFDKQFEVQSVGQLINTWLHGTSCGAQLGYTIVGVIVFSLWEI